VKQKTRAVETLVLDPVVVFLAENVTAGTTRRANVQLGVTGLVLSEESPATHTSVHVTNTREHISSLFAWRSGAREEFEVKVCRQATAGGGDRLAIDLEFEFLSRIIASMQSMTRCRPHLNGYESHVRRRNEAERRRSGRS
jgi:hypothetical protein